MTATIKCTCAHKAQDEIYGPGLRLMNGTLKEKKDKGGPPVVFRCTVCLTEKKQFVFIEPTKKASGGKK